MARHDYEAMDEDDFYGQQFERDGMVSVWVGLVGQDNGSGEDDVDALQDLCGVGYYNPDNQEMTSHDFQLLPLRDLLRELSYSSSFRSAVLKVASGMGIEAARWLVVQYDFAYDPTGIKRSIATDPLFIGVFPYARS